MPSVSEIYDLPDYKGFETAGMPANVVKDSRSYKENEAILNPLPGDHWDDNSVTSLNLFVLKTTPRLVWIASAVGPFQENFTVEVFRRDQFNAFMRLGGQDRYKGLSPWQPTSDIFAAPNRARLCLQERGINVDGWLEFAIENNRSYIEHTPV